MDAITIGLVWILFSIWSYLIYRNSYVIAGLDWKCSDRRLALFLSIAGPFSFLGSSIAWVIIFFTCVKDDPPAKW